MATNITYKSADGETPIVGKTENLGQVLASASAEVDTMSVKICVENVGARALGVTPFTALLLRRLRSGVNDGIDFVFTAEDDNGTLSKPWGADVDEFDVPTGAVAAALDVTGPYGPYGSWGSIGLKGVRVTAVNAVGETGGSVEKTFIVAALTDEWRYDWASLAAAGATGYNVYVTDTPGDYSAARMIFVDSGSTTHFVDDGTLGTPTAIPAANTTGGAGPTYGTAPAVGSHTADDKAISAGGAGFAVGQQWFFWLIAKVFAGTTEDGNTRQMDINPTEVA